MGVGVDVLAIHYLKGGEKDAGRDQQVSHGSGCDYALPLLSSTKTQQGGKKITYSSMTSRVMVLGWLAYDPLEQSYEP